MLKCTEALPRFAGPRWPFLLSAEPQGWKRSLQGGGPLSLAQLALDQEHQGGDKMITSNLPAKMRAMPSSKFSPSKRS